MTQDEFKQLCREIGKNETRFFKGTKGRLVILGRPDSDHQGCFLSGVVLESGNPGFYPAGYFSRDWSFELFKSVSRLEEERLLKKHFGREPEPEPEPELENQEEPPKKHFIVCYAGGGIYETRSAVRASLEEDIGTWNALNPTEQCWIHSEHDTWEDLEAEKQRLMAPPSPQPPVSGGIKNPETAIPAMIELLKRAAGLLQDYCTEVNGDMNDGLATEIEAFLKEHTDGK